jgi:hypothetical protein
MRGEPARGGGVVAIDPAFQRSSVQTFSDEAKHTFGLGSKNPDWKNEGLLLTFSRRLVQKAVAWES